MVSGLSERYFVPAQALVGHSKGIFLQKQGIFADLQFKNIKILGKTLCYLELHPFS